MIKKTGLMLMLTGMTFTLFAPKTVRQDFASYPVVRNNHDVLREDAIKFLCKRLHEMGAERANRFIDKYNPQHTVQKYVRLRQMDLPVLKSLVIKFERE